VAARPILIISNPPAAAGKPQRAVSRYAAVSDYWALTKPEVNVLIAVATFTGFYLGHATQSQSFPFLLLINTLLGTLLVASGTGTLNQYIERRFDAQMRRTARRPLAAGRLKPSVVLWFGVALSTAGSIYLATTVNVFASVLAIVTLLSYLFLYTPLKRKTPLCILVGAFPGAMPPLIGWAAASGRLSTEAWILYVMLFLWQFPHFMPISCGCIAKTTIARVTSCCPRARREIALWFCKPYCPSWPCFPSVCCWPGTNQPSILYCTGALLLSSGFFYYGARFVLYRSTASARRLLVASIIYLPSLFALMSFLRG
jgi:protoheme IX farnesyltransferase